MTPLFWLDEDGHRLPTRKCVQPTCDREYPVRRYCYHHLRMIGWPLFRVARFVNWCLTPVPEDAEWVRLVPIIGTVK